MVTREQCHLGLRDGSGYLCRLLVCHCCICLQCRQMQTYMICLAWLAVQHTAGRRGLSCQVAITQLTVCWL